LNAGTDMHGLSRTNTGARVGALDWTLVAANVRFEIVRADFTERQARVAVFMVSATLERGRQEVRGMKLEELELLLGISKGNLSEVFYELQLCGFLQVIESPTDGRIYRVMPLSELWTVPWRYSAARMEGYLQALDVASGHFQQELLEPEPDLRAAIAETQMANAMEDGSRTSASQWKMEKPNKTDDAARSSLPSARFSVSSRSPLNRESLADLSKSSSNSASDAASNGVRGGRDLENGFSIKGSFEGSSGDFTDGLKAVKAIGEVPNSGTGEQLHTGNGKWKMENGKAEGKTQWSDDRYIVDKLRAHCVKLFEELWGRRTRLARDFAALYSVNPSKAQELVGEAVGKNYPARWLNVSVAGYFGWKKQSVNHHAGTSGSHTEAPSGVRA
jgi:hypothetical protein